MLECAGSLTGKGAQGGCIGGGNFEQGEVGGETEEVFEEVYQRI